ncbi:5-carboxymethyl-2-hydroxymuconate Delta-isomerase [Streptomyces mexicanus]|jgi:5-carboxymethyl-2-hydroxymuconate isomerase|uniref:5-carboxymethyl-2-hydroxymuconate Delta-isomerase n=1 Tax=Streptomyces mexicanus TaxID=178566 RepID=UPI0036B508AE
MRERFFMPHLTIDYSSQLADSFDRGALIKELHPLVLEETGSTGVCKTFFRPAEAHVGDATGEESVFVHVEIGLMPGRPDALKAHLSESVLALVARHLPADRADRAFVSVEVRDLAESYRLTPTARSPLDT